MRIFRLWAAALLMATLAGCAVQPPAIPSYQDPLPSLGVQAAHRSDIPLRLLAGRRVAIVVSDNTRQLVDWQVQADKIYRGNWAVTALVDKADRQAQLENNDPQLIVQRPAAMLKANFSGLDIVGSLGEARQKGYGYVAVLDIHKESDVVRNMTVRFLWRGNIFFVQAQDTPRVVHLVSAVTQRVCDASSVGISASHSFFARCDAELRNQMFDGLERDLQRAVQTR